MAHDKVLVFNDGVLLFLFQLLLMFGELIPGNESDFFTVRAPFVLADSLLVVEELLRLPAVRVHDKKPLILSPFSQKRKSFAIRLPLKGSILQGLSGHFDGFAALERNLPGKGMGFILFPVNFPHYVEDGLTIGRDNTGYSFERLNIIKTDDSRLFNLFLFSLLPRGP